MIEQLNLFFKKIFNNEETIVFSIALIAFFIIISIFGSILTPFMISIVVAYLLVGLQKKFRLQKQAAVKKADLSQGIVFKARSKPSGSKGVIN